MYIVFICIHTHTSTHVHTCIYTHANTYPHTLMHAQIYTHTQGFVLALTLFNTAIDFVMGRTVDRSMVGVSVGNQSYTDMDYTD